MNAILYSLFFSFVIVATPIFSQRTAYQSIDERQFKLYKIKKLGFLFKGMQGESASKHGVIMPMLIIQIQGYLLGLLSFALVLIDERLLLSIDAVLINIIVLLVHCHAVMLVTIITGLVGKRRKNKRRK